MQAFWDQITSLLGGYIPSLVGALLILIIGWIVASIVAAGVGSALKRTKLDNRLAKALAGGGETTTPINTEKLVSRVVYYLLMLFVLIAFFQALQLTIVTEPLNQLLTTVFAFAPQIFGAAILLLIAWAVATLLRLLVSKALTALKLDERLGSSLETEQVSLSKTLADVVYWLVFLFFLPAILGSLELDGMLQPVLGMLNTAFNFLPNLIAAAIILVVGWFVARLVRQIVSNLLAAAGLNRLSERVGLNNVLGEMTLSGILGLIIYVFILIPVLIAALNALDLDSVTQPASTMLTTILNALPNIFAAIIVLSLAYVVGRIVSGFVTNILTGIGFNSLPARLGLATEASEQAENRRTPAEVVGYLVLVGIMLFATIEALNLLDFALLAGLVSQFTVILGQIIFGLIIFGLGLFLANFAAQIIRSSGVAQASLLALIARVAILVLVGAMALTQMGLATDIVNLAFGLFLGSLAVAAALAFGLGGREVAGRELNGWVQRLKDRS